MTDDEAVARQLEDAFWDELDRQHLEDDGVQDGLYVDAISGCIDGYPNVQKLLLAVLHSYWEENGR